MDSIYIYTYIIPISIIGILQEWDIMGYNGTYASVNELHVAKSLQFSNLIWRFSAVKMI